MRYRKVNSPKDLAGDLRTFHTFIGYTTYRSLLDKRIDSILEKGFISDVEMMRYGTEIALHEIDRRRNKPAKLLTAPMFEKVHLGIDLILGVAQTIPFTTGKARNTLRGQLLDGLKSAGLQNLHHEMRVACELSRRGLDVHHNGLENQGSFDYLAVKDGSEFEVEAKTFSTDTGNPIHHQDAEHFFADMKRAPLKIDNSRGVPILSVKLTGRMPPDDESRRLLVQLSDEVLTTGSSREIPFGGCISLISYVSHQPKEKLQAAIRKDASLTGALIFGRFVSPQFIVRLLSSARNKGPQAIARVVKDSAVRQFSGNRPGIIWSHIYLLKNEMFDALVRPRHGHKGFLDTLATKILSSRSRDHICQLIFSGGSSVQHNPVLSSTFRAAAPVLSKASKSGAVVRSGSYWHLTSSEICKFGTARMFD